LAGSIATPDLFVPVVLGSVRSNRRSHRPALLLEERAKAAGHRTELIDLRALNLPLHGQDDANGRHPSVVAFKETIARADAVVWLSPEYNHAYTAATKNAIDYLGRELARKPVAVCGLSSGSLGGARAVEQLKLVFVELRAVPIRESVYFSEAESIFDSAGQLARHEFVERIDRMLDDLTWFARALRWGRAELGS